jgi:undecaprenyl diphosphate synthase
MAKPDLKTYRDRMDKSVASLKEDFAGLRTGRANAGLLEPVMVEAYGSTSPLNAVAAISVPEPRMISVSVWDKSMVTAVEKAIRSAGLGLNPVVDGQTLRLPVPPLTEERRKELVKLAGKYAEQARVAVRNIRRDGNDDLKKAEKASEISQDDQKKMETEIQKDTDAAIKRIDETLKTKEAETLASVPSKGPRHVALIMDGNGRWAERRGLPRVVGHREGVQALRRTVKAAPDFGIQCLTVFGFSTENWSRPADEVSDLMGLVRSFVGSDLKKLDQAGVRIRVLGRREGVASDILKMIDKAVEQTAGNDRFLLQVAFNYGARADLVDAAQALVDRVRAGEFTGPVTEDDLAVGLSSAGAPPVDLIIRTSGEQRLSNFLLWEAAYAELVFQDVLWPDYGAEALAEAVDAFAHRDRRFGGRHLDDSQAKMAVG